MNRDEALATLRSHRAALQAIGLSALYLFGSTANGSARPDSDIDLLFEIEPEAKFSLLDQASAILQLEALLERPVDLVERTSLRPHIRPRVEAELVRVF